MEITSNILNVFKLNWLFGPIADKELRISSRRKRNYFLRIAYLALLLSVVLIIWADTVNIGNRNLVYQASRLSKAGLAIISFVVVFQFYAAQILAIIMLSNSISEEIQKNTLSVLMSTPITSTQIVAGKLASKLLQIGLLLCCTLPILGIVRVFGGVPWNFLLAGFCMTVTAVLFAAMLSINLSIHCKHAHTVIIATLITLAGLYFLIPWFVAYILIEWLDITSESTFVYWLSMFDPIVTIQALLEKLLNPGTTGIPKVVWWPACLVMLTGSSLLFLKAAVVVRKKAMPRPSAQHKRKRRKKVSFFRRHSGYSIRLKGLPDTGGRLGIFWWLTMTTMVAGIFISCVFLPNNRTNDFLWGIQAFFAWMIPVVFINAMIASATAITKEKQSRTLVALLTTPLTDSQIINGRIKQICRRSWVLWAMIMADFIAFGLTALIDYSPPVEEVLMILFVSVCLCLYILSLLLFVMCLGSYISVRAKTGTAAILTTLGGFLGWVFLSLFLLFIFSVCEPGIEVLYLSLITWPIANAIAAFCFLELAKKSLRRYALA